VNIKTINEEDYVSTTFTETGDNDKEDAEEYEQLVPPQFSLKSTKDLDILIYHIAETNRNQYNDPQH
jgi:hypothetical protein